LFSETKSLGLQQQEGRILRVDKDYLCTLKTQACEKCQKKAYYRQFRCLDLATVYGDMLYCRERESVATRRRGCHFQNLDQTDPFREAITVYIKGQRAAPDNCSF
jgi:hypothetical protein